MFRQTKSLLSVFIFLHYNLNTFKEGLSIIRWYKDFIKMFQIYDKLIIHLRFLKTTSDTTSLNISSVVSSMHTPTIPHSNTYAASRHIGMPMRLLAGNINHHYHFCIAAASYNTASEISNHFWLMLSNYFVFVNLFNCVFTSRPPYITRIIVTTCVSSFGIYRTR